MSSRTRLLWSAVSPQMIYSLRLSNRSQIVAKMNHLQYSTVPIAIGYQVPGTAVYPVPVLYRGRGRAGAASEPGRYTFYGCLL